MGKESVSFPFRISCLLRSRFLMPPRLHRGKLLFVNRVFPPVPGATGLMLDQLSSELVRDGWEVTILASRGEGGAGSEVLPDGRRIEWVHGLKQGGTRFRQRAIAYLRLYPALLWRLLTLPRPDVVIPMTDPPLLVVLGPLVLWLRGVPVVHWAQDIYPEVAVALKVVKPGGILAGFTRWASTYALRRCAHIVAIGRCMEQRLRGRGLAADRISVIPNWADTDAIRPVVRDENTFRQRHGLDGKFVVMYSGNFGLAHDIDVLLEAAVEVRQRPEIHFLFVGSGSRLVTLQAKFADMGLNNVSFLPPQPWESLSESLSAGDLHMVTLRPGVEGTVVPSKLYGIFAAGRPTLYVGAVDSEGALLLREHNCGTVVPAPNGRDLAQTILEWSTDLERCAGSGRRARQLAEAESMSRCAAAFSRVLAGILPPSRFAHRE